MTDNLFDVPDPDITARDELTLKWKDKTPEEVLKAKVDADLYIKTLERQKDELRTDYLKQREELLTKAKFEEYLDRMEKTSGNIVPNQTPVNDVESPKYDPLEVQKLVKNEIMQNKIIDKESENFKLVQKKLQEKFGNNYPSILQETQTTLGLTPERVNALAKESPEAFFRMMGFNDQPKDNFQAPPRSGQRNDTFAPRGAPKRDWNYYQELKKTNPKIYLDPKISVQMHNDAIEQGDAFYG